MHNLRVVVKFYLGQNEDYSISDNSEKLLRRGGGGGRGEVSTYVILVKGSSCNQAHIFYRFLLVVCRPLLVTRSECHHEGFQCFSRYEEMQEVGS